MIKDPIKWDLYCKKDHDLVLEWGVKPTLKGARKTGMTVLEASRLTQDEIMNLPIYQLKLVKEAKAYAQTQLEADENLEFKYDFNYWQD